MYLNKLSEEAVKVGIIIMLKRHLNRYVSRRGMGNMQVNGTSSVWFGQVRLKGIFHAI